MRQEGNGGNRIKDWDCVNKYFGGCIKLNLTYKMKINNLTNSLFLGGNGGSKANLLNSYWICKKKSTENNSDQALAGTAQLIIE